MQAAILYYSGAAFGPRTPPFLVEKLESFPQLIWLYTKHLMDMFPRLQIEEEIKFQSYILSFLDFLVTGKQYMKTSMKVFIKKR